MAAGGAVRRPAHSVRRAGGVGPVGMDGLAVGSAESRAPQALVERLFYSRSRGPPEEAGRGERWTAQPHHKSIHGTLRPAAPATGLKVPLCTVMTHAGRWLAKTNGAAAHRLTAGRCPARSQTPIVSCRPRR